MKALSIMPEYAMEILRGEKTVEYRSWQTKHRGDLLICASSRPKRGCIAGYALCVVNLAKIVKYADDCYDWYLTDLRMIRPFKVKGKLHLYEVDDKLISYPPDTMTPTQVYKRYYEPLVKH